MTARTPTSTADPAGRVATSRRRRPPTEYWDLFSASWRSSRPAVPLPRSGS